MNLLWVTDLHLNPQVEDDDDKNWSAFLAAIAQHDADRLLVSGDIAEADSFGPVLVRLAAETNLPIGFVLGNHDFYGSSVGKVRRHAVDLDRQHCGIDYLTDGYPISMGNATVLLGEDGWGDATIGDYENSYVKLNDFRRIADFSDHPSDQWKSTLRRLGKESSHRLADKLSHLPDGVRHALVVTHVPPFREACWYQGRTANDAWAPFFVCGAVGDCLRQAAQQNPQIEFTVLCGHTHHAGVARIEENLVIHTGAAMPGRLNVEGLIRCDGASITVHRVQDP